MTIQRSSREAATGASSPGRSTAIVLLGTELLLVAFSIGSAALDQSALAIMAGTASITLAGEIVRRLPLSPIGTVPEPPSASGDSPAPPGTTG